MTHTYIYPFLLSTLSLENLNNCLSGVIKKKRQKKKPPGIPRLNGDLYFVSVKGCMSKIAPMGLQRRQSTPGWKNGGRAGLYLKIPRLTQKSSRNLASTEL